MLNISAKIFLVFAILKFLNDFLAEIKDDGRFDRIYNKWFKTTDWFNYVR